MDSETQAKQPSPPPPTTPKESKKKQGKDRRKGEKKTENFMKSITNYTMEEKVDILCEKYSSSVEEIRTLKGSLQLLQRKITILEKEREQLQNEHSKTVLTKSHLEALCRELQKQNKSIKDESLQKIKEEEEKRKEVSNRFQTALNEVCQMMQQNTEKNLKLRDDNIEISNKFKKLCDQFKKREEEVTRLKTEMDLEKQLAKTTLNRIECQLHAERNIWNKEKENFTTQLKLHEEEKLKLEKNINALEDNLSMYVTKYDEFENVILKSNQVFDGYKTEITDMSKQITTFKQENNIWKEKWAKSQQQVTKITNDHRSCQENVETSEKKIKQLTELCRCLHEERTTYLKQLKENGLIPATIERPEPPAPAATNEAPPKSSHKLTKKEKELNVLKKEMQDIETKLADTLIANIEPLESAVAGD